MRHREATFFPDTMPVIAFGADYNPEQWPQEVWENDVALMKQAGVNLVTVGVFSWATIEPEEGVRNFEWLDALLDLLAANDIRVDLATPIASPPPWVGAKYPETLAVWENGYTTTWGSRNHFSPASQKYRDLCTTITRDLVERYAHHPAVAMWHIGNEFGQICYSNESARRFQDWLKERYHTLDALNHAWGTAFWSQGLSNWDHVIPPRQTTYLNNPAQVLDFKRYSSDLMLSMYTEQVEIIRAVDPHAVITTNFMGFFHLVDYHTWAPHVDVIADDIYPDPLDPHTPSTTALTQELMRSLRGGKPWMVMEQAITTVNWRAHNVPKTPAQTRLESLAAIARGARGICFFQWRQSTSGSERFHSALLPHAGENSEVHRSVRQLGGEIAALSTLYSGANYTSVGASRRAQNAPVALVFDWSSWWASTGTALPTGELNELEVLKAWHRQLWLRGIRADIVSPNVDLSVYSAVLVPSLHLVSTEQAASLEAFAHNGGTLALGPFTAVADLTNRVIPGLFPAHFSQSVGVGVQEWIPLPPQTVIDLEGPHGSQTAGTATEATSQQHPNFTAHTFVEKLDTTSPETQVHLQVKNTTPDPFHLNGRPLVTSKTHGAGTVWYLGGLLDPDTLGSVLEHITTSAGVASLPETQRSEGLDVISDSHALYLLNYAHQPTELRTSELEKFLGHPLNWPHDVITIPAQDAVIINHQHTH